MIYFTCNNIGNYGGAAVVAMDIVESLIATGKPIGIINKYTRIPERLKKEFKKATWLDMPFRPEKRNYKDSKFGTVKYLIRSFQSKVEMFRLKKHLMRNSPDIMLFNALTKPEQNVFNNFEHETKTIQIVHLSPEFLVDFDNAISLDDTLDIFKKSDALIFVSDECRKEWLSYKGLNNKRSFYIPNCANELKAKELLENSKEDIRINLNMDSEKFYLVSVASFQPRKGQDLLVKAAHELKKIAPNLEILFVGGGSGKYFNELKRKCDNQGLGFVNFLGTKTNAMDYIFASDAFILTSRAEAFPLVILEAMVLNTPVLASNVNGVPEMIDDRENGYLFKSDNVENLIAAFESIYTNKEERKNFAVKSSRKYWDDFSKKHFVDRYKSVIHEMLE